MTAAQRFQHYVEDWAYPDQYEAELYPLGELSKIPISLIYGETDNICTAEKALELAEELNPDVLCSVIEMEGHGHVFPIYGWEDLFDVLNYEIEEAECGEDDDSDEDSEEEEEEVDSDEDDEDNTDEDEDEVAPSVDSSV